MPKYKPPHPKQKSDKTLCKVCGKIVEWEMTPAGWRLFDAHNQLHECVDPFEVLRNLENEKTTQPS